MNWEDNLPIHYDIVIMSFHLIKFTNLFTISILFFILYVYQLKPHLILWWILSFSSYKIIHGLIHFLYGSLCHIFIILEYKFKSSKTRSHQRLKVVNCIQLQNNPFDNLAVSHLLSNKCDYPGFYHAKHYNLSNSVDVSFGLRLR